MNLTSKKYSLIFDPIKTFRIKFNYFEISLNVVQTPVKLLSVLTDCPKLISLKQDSKTIKYPPIHYYYYTYTKGGGVK